MRRGFQKPAIQAKKAKFDSDNFETSIGVNFEEIQTTKIGYLANIKTTSFQDQNGGDLSAVLLYFLEPSGQWFKAMLQYEPYFYILCAQEAVKEIVFYLNKTFESYICKIDYVDKEDLSLINHLSGKTQKYLKLSFKNVQDLILVRNELQVIVQRNLKNKETQEAYEGFYNPSDLLNQHVDSSQYLTKITELREFDVAYHIRVSIDNEIRCAFWYEVDLDGPLITGIKHLKEKLDKADLRILAFDIETTKAPLKFPDSRFDQIMMISYVLDGRGYLITNRTVVGADVQDFEYSPKPEYDVGVFTVFNEPDEKGLLDKFFNHIRETKPFIYTTFNGDFFDWVFIEDRCKVYSMTLEDQIGVFCNSQSEYTGRFAVHMDCFYWVQRDAYLPQGSHGLKAVTKAKLGYDPVELEPELMVPYAKERPQELAEYSVSDAVATYFLYHKMIHDFIFALCTIIPTNPDEVLRKGSGTLCEDLLMAQAFRCNIIFPNKQQEKFERFYQGHLIDTETYIGGHVECLRTGVYRSDIPVKFRLEKAGYQGLIDQAEAIMDFALKIELNIDKNLVTNYNELRDEIISKLEGIKSKCPLYEAEPLIYHVDVAAMYPNIILSNRLQPVAIVNEQICAGCIFNKEESNCKRNLNWQWKGEYFPLTRKEYEGVKNQLVYEEEKEIDNKREWTLGTLTEQQRLKLRVKKYCQNVYKQVHTTKIDLKSDTVCMRENSFYVDTVRDFRDRRYEYKNLVKVWAGKLSEASKENNALKMEEARNLMSLFESLQLAHKIILNSFYGYVMRRGARWYSMEMAAMVTHTGGAIIMDSRSLFDQIGIPLELDTDGIWTLLPKGFPEWFQFQLSNGKKANFSFPCTMCNVLIYDKYSNKQYQTLVNPKTLEYKTNTEMSVFFEIDGPYRAMVIPASKEENKMLKKRYAVFNHAGKMTEVKGFELKRRGELKIIKIFQEEVFSKFLEGKTLQECYDACGEVAERWYDILDTEGEYIDDSELIEYIGESRFLSKTLAEYDGQKSPMVTCAIRLSEFLGPEIVRGKGTNVKFIIAKKPLDAKVAGRVIPTAIFESDPNVMKKFLRKWLKDAAMTDFDMRTIIDWNYYKERVSSTIQKIITIPAALQKCLNPVPRIKYPDWLHKKIKAHDEKFKQKDMKYFFKNQQKQPIQQLRDIEDSASSANPLTKPIQKLSISSNTENKVQNKNKQQQIVDQFSNIEDCPPPEDNFKDWLKYQKSNWRKIRKNIKDDKKVIKDVAIAKNQGLNSFIRNMDDVVLKSSWHILQISETFEPGIMKIWALTDSGQMFSVKLKVPRIIYINSKTICQDADFRKVQKVLPRERKSYHLYEWESSEDAFIDKFHNLTYHHLMNPTVEGVYETKTPLLFKAILELGCLVKPKFNMIPKNEQALGRVYKTSELELRHSTGSDSVYLPSNTYERIYLLQSQSQNSRHLWALFTESTKDAQFFVVNPVANSRNPGLQGALNYKTIFINTLTEQGLQTDYIDWDISNNQNTFNELSSCLKAIDHKLQEYKSKVKSATIVVIQSEYTPEKLMFMGMPTLANEFPCMKCPQIATDNEYPALDWIRFAVKNMALRFTEINDWIKEKINFARYSYIPVCNLEGDAPLFIIDTLYARNLALNKHVLWYSDTSKPDLGGHEDKDFRIYFQDEIENPEINQKGFYRGYTVEIDLTQFAVNTILQSEFLKDFEEASILATQYQQLDRNGNRGQGNFVKLQNNSEFDNDLDEYVTCAGVFKKLRELVNCWLSDVLRDDQYADRLISHLYRWLSSPSSSKMYDPLLHRLVHQLMKKNFYQLMLRLKQLGCKVIYSSFHKIMIHTERDTFEEAENFINFVIHTIKQNPMFSFIQMTPNEYYKILLFKDIYNYGGIKESNPQKVSNKWDICLHLPQAIQRKFLLTVGEYILKVYKHNLRMKLEGQQNELNGNSNQQENNKIESYMDTVDDVKKEKDHEYIAKLITEYFSQKLFPLVNEFLTKKEDMVSDGDDDDYEEENLGQDDQPEYDEEVDENDQNYLNTGYAQQDNKYAKLRKQKDKERKAKELKKWEFPQRIGSYNDYKNAALEFSKQICKNVFGLDEAFSSQTTTLKRNLLSMIREKEFSSSVVNATEPSLILVIPDVICEVCQTSRDLDICRDPSLNNDVQDNADQNQEGCDWKCQQCENVLNKGLIERRLVELMNRRVVSYQIQDLKCIKCQMINNTLVSRYCECTGQFKQTIGFEKPEKLKNPNLLNNMTDIKLFIQLMRNFATYHNMPILKDCSQQLMILYS